MQIFHTLEAWRNVRDARSPQASLGFVPTMGNLHQGHLSLVQQSQSENTDTLVSLFINQTQFNNPDDFTLYPRTLDADINLLKQANVQYCLIPTTEAIYPDEYRFQLHETTNHQQLEGKTRPNHFTGVLTVVMKLLQIAKPQRLYLGEKDYEQYQLIRDMVNAFFMDIDVIACPTIRETSGLAYSSRNNRLSPHDKKRAEQFAHAFHTSTSCSEAIMTLGALGVDVEYLEEHNHRRFAAVNIGGIRLIDNYALDPRSQQATFLEPSRDGA